MPMTPANKKLLVIVVVIIAAFLLYGLLTMPDQRTTAERIGDAIGELPKGPDKAADQLKDRTPIQKMGDAVEDAGDEIKRNTQ